MLFHSCEAIQPRPACGHLCVFIFWGNLDAINFFLVAAVAAGLATANVHAQERVNGAIQQHGLLGRSIAPDEFHIEHASEFKGAQ